MPFSPNKPYNDLPKLPPSVVFETAKVLKKAVSANKALAELKGMTRLIPHPTLLLNTLTLEEARDSSEIENIVTTRDKLYRALASNLKSVDPATKEVLRYREALWYGFDVVKKRKLITTNIILDIQKTLIHNNAGVRKLPGTQLVNDATGKVRYTPPEGERLIRDLLSNVEKFLNTENGIDPLVRLALLHYQFEAIHPFYDGNGRTGRILNVLYLVHAGLLDLPILYMSRYIIQHRNAYYKLLRSVTTDETWEEWILFMLDAVEQTSLDTIEKVNKIRGLLDATIEKVKKELPSIYTKELVELLFEQPYCKVNFLVDAEIVERKTAAKYLDLLVENGLLKKQAVGKESVYLNVPLYSLFSKGAPKLK